MESGNYFAYNLGLNPAVNFNFMLRVEGVMDLPCKSVRAFQKENEYETIQEGGLNDYVHMRRKPISRPFTFQVDRYVGVDILDPLSNGTELVLPLILYVNRYSVYGEFYPVRCYVFTGCTVISKEYGELNAEQSGLLMETTTIAYREMFAIDNPAGSYLTADTWQFDKNTKDGKGKKKARTPENELRASAMMNKSQKWMFKDGYSYQKYNSNTENNGEDSPGFLGIKGRTTGSDYGKNEVRKNAMEGKAVKYSFKDQKPNRAKTDETETDKKAMEGKARKWPKHSSAMKAEDFMKQYKLGQNNRQ